MGTCKTNCCTNEKFATYTISADPDETCAPINNTKSNAKLDPSDRWEAIEEIIESNLISLNYIDSKYDSSTYQYAGSLFNPDIYEILMRGGSLEPLIADKIILMKNSTLFTLLDYIYETISNFCKSTEDEFSTGLSNYFKISFKKHFVELNEIETVDESSVEIRKLLEASLSNFIEVYHFFKYYQNGMKKFKIASYKDNYWKGIHDINSHMKRVIFSTVDLMTKSNKLMTKTPDTDSKTNYDSQLSINRKMISTSNFLNSVFVKSIG